MAMAMQEMREFAELKHRVQTLEEEIRKLQDRNNELNGNISYLKGLAKEDRPLQKKG